MRGIRFKVFILIVLAWITVLAVFIVGYIRATDREFVKETYNENIINDSVSLTSELYRLEQVKKELEEECENTYLKPVVSYGYYVTEVAEYLKLDRNCLVVIDDNADENLLRRIRNDQRDYVVSIDLLTADLDDVKKDDRAIAHWFRKQDYSKSFINYVKEKEIDTVLLHADRISDERLNEGIINIAYSYIKSDEVMIDNRIEYVINNRQPICFIFDSALSEDTVNECLAYLNELMEENKIYIEDLKEVISEIKEIDKLNDLNRQKNVELLLETNKQIRIIENELEKLANK